MLCVWCDVLTISLIACLVLTELWICEHINSYSLCITKWTYQLILSLSPSEHINSYSLYQQVNISTHTLLYHQVIVVKQPYIYIFEINTSNVTVLLRVTIMQHPPSDWEKTNHMHRALSTWTETCFWEDCQSCNHTQPSSDWTDNFVVDTQLNLSLSTLHYIHWSTNTDTSTHTRHGSNWWASI